MQLFNSDQRIQQGILFQVTSTQSFLIVQHSIHLCASVRQWVTAATMLDELEHRW